MRIRLTLSLIPTVWSHLLFRSKGPPCLSRSLSLDPEVP